MASQRQALAALISLVALTTVPTAAMPPFVGHYVDGFGYSLELAGRIASAESIGMAFGQLAVLMLIGPRWNIRRTVQVTLCLFVFAQVLSLWPDKPALFASARFLSGFCGGGVMFATAGAYIASLARPDRPFAVLYGMLFVVGPIGLLALPHIFEAVGARTVYLLLGAGVLLSLVGLRHCPDRPEHRAGTGQGTGRLSLAPTAKLVIALLLASLVFNYISNGGVWIYLERIGDAMAIPDAIRGTWLALGMAFGVVGTVAAIACADLLNRYMFITLGQVFLLLSYASLLFGEGTAGFLTAACLLNAAVTFYTPFYLAQMAAIDPSGRSTTLGMLGFAFGYGLGPGVLSFFILDGDFSGAILAAAATVLISLVLLWLAAAMRPRPSAFAKPLASDQ